MGHDHIHNIDTIHGSDISLTRDLITGQDLITDLTLLLNSGMFPKNIFDRCGYQTENAYSSGIWSSQTILKCVLMLRPFSLELVSGLHLHDPILL